jgi:hypothetical protein
MLGNTVDTRDTEHMVPTVVLSALVLLAAIGYLVERHGHRPGVQARPAMLVEQKRNACAASYLRESITNSLVHDPHHPGYSGRRR